MDTAYYKYDAIGQLIQDSSYHQNYNLKIKWTPYGKVDSIKKYDTTGALVMYHAYLYDAMGNQVEDNSGTPAYHIYDAANTQLAVYTSQLPVLGSNGMGVSERYIYGSDRLATIKGPNTVNLFRKQTLATNGPERDATARGGCELPASPWRVGRVFLRIDKTAKRLFNKIVANSSK